LWFTVSGAGFRVLGSGRMFRLSPTSGVALCTTSPKSIGRVAYKPRPEVSVCPMNTGSPSTIESKVGGGGVLDKCRCGVLLHKRERDCPHLANSLGTAALLAIWAQSMALVGATRGVVPSLLRPARVLASLSCLFLSVLRPPLHSSLQYSCQS
jgi:hypothetical protein